MGVIGRGPQCHAEFVEKTIALGTDLRGETIQLDDWESRIEWRWLPGIRAGAIGGHI